MLKQNLPQKGDVIAGKYQIDGMLGTGGMGAVYRVTHRVTGKAFAIKWLLPKLSAETDAVQRFIREAQVAGRVDHPNIVEVYDVGQEGDSFYMVMELLHGESLAQRMAAKGRLSAAELCTILIPVTRGLEAAHRAGVVHRDLKPDNIYLCREDDGVDLPKLLDFGISKMSELTGELSSGITRQGTIMGTPFYMAPEQMRGLAVDARTDVYALGVILYQGLSGQLPFTGETLADLLVKIVSTDPKPLARLAPELPAALVSIVERALAREPAARVSSAAALGELLVPFASAVHAGRASQRPGSVRPAPSTTATPLATESSAYSEPPPPVRKSSRALIALSTSLAAAVAGGVWWSQIPADKRAAQPVAEQERLVRPLVVPAPSPDNEPPAAANQPTNIALGGEELPKPNTHLERADAQAQLAQPAAPAQPEDSVSPREEPTPPQPPRTGELTEPRQPGPKRPKPKPTAPDPFQMAEPKPVTGRGSIKVSMDQFGLTPDSPRAKP